MTERDCVRRLAGRARGAAAAAVRHSSAALLAGLALAAPAARAEAPRELPAFTHTDAAAWLNSPPLSAESLRGHPVLVEVWTFECGNCLASLPWLRRIVAEYAGRGLRVVGVHSPELPAEHDARAVAAAVRRLGIRYPVMLDADLSYWQRLGNRYWPAFYLYDASGHLLATRIGELHSGEPAADSFEQALAAALPVRVT